MSEEWIDDAIRILGDHLPESIHPGRYLFGAYTPHGVTPPIDEIEETGLHEIPARYSRTGEPNPLAFY